LPVDFHEYINFPWLILMVVWAVGAITAKRNERTQHSASLLIHACLIIVAFALLFWRRLSVGLLSWRFVPDSAALAGAGFALTVAGVAVAIWARFFLGRNWSGIVTIKQDHRLVRRGPYAIVRHPIYAGFVLAMLGTALVLGELRGLLAVAVALTHWWAKSRIEERFLLEQFGAEYAQYRREVKALIPFVL